MILYTVLAFLSNFGHLHFPFSLLQNANSCRFFLLYLLCLSLQLFFIPFYLITPATFKSPPFPLVTEHSTGYWIISCHIIILMFIFNYVTLRLKCSHLSTAFWKAHTPQRSSKSTPNCLSKLIPYTYSTSLQKRTASLWFSQHHACVQNLITLFHLKLLFLLFFASLLTNF